MQHPRSESLIINGNSLDRVGGQFGYGQRRLRFRRITLTAETETDHLTVWVDQDLCTGDGLCVQYAPEVFEFDIDGLAYVKAAKECPGDCIHVVRRSDDVEVAGPDAA